MGFFDFFDGKPSKSGQRSSTSATTAKSAKVAFSPSHDGLVYNKRKYLRYFIEEIPGGAIGYITEMSKDGVRLMKRGDFIVKEEETDMTFRIGEVLVKTSIAWQTEDSIGLKFEEPFNAIDYIKQHMIKPLTELPNPSCPITYMMISQYKSYDFMTPVTNLLAELESAEAKMNRLKLHIAEISGVHKKWVEAKDVELKERQKSIRAGTPVEKLPPFDSSVFPDFSQELFQHSAGSKGGTDAKDIDCIVARLGMDSLKKLSASFVKRNRARVEVSLPGFKNYHQFSVLKTVFLKEVAPFFGYRNDNNEGSSLLSLEVCGLKILMKNSNIDLDNIYTSPSRFYTETARVYEKVNFGYDLVHLNKMYFGKALNIFTDIIDGYMMGNLILNPHMFFDRSLKFNITKTNLSYSFVVYLSYLVVNFVMDADMEAGVVLFSKLKRTGMEETKIMGFINSCISEANKVLSGMDVKESIKPVVYPRLLANPESIINNNPAFAHFLKSIIKSNAGDGKRMVIRYDDESYCHYLLNRLLVSDVAGLKSRIVCVVPCANLTDDAMYFEDFASFDLVIFKGLDKLTLYHRQWLIRFWESYEGKIIATVNSESIFDIFQKELYEVMKDHFVEFPSYMRNPELHAAMVMQSLKYSDQFTKHSTVDNGRYEKYMDKRFSMKHVQSLEVLNLMPRNVKKEAV
jgi:hypothetical protein